MVFNCIRRFTSDTSLLTKKPKNGYSSVEADLKKLFKDATFAGLYSAQDIRIIGSSKLIKMRCPISCSSTGAQGGFRVIFLANPNNETITLCHIFPKKGKLGKANCGEEEVTEILNEVVNEINELQLVDYLPQPARVSGEPVTATGAPPVDIKTTEVSSEN